MKNNNNSRNNSENGSAKKTFETGKSPEMDAWMTTFYIENHLDPFTHPDQAATPEQIRFMVYLKENERYHPCSDRMFEAIMSRKESAFIRENYTAVLNRILNLIKQKIEHEEQRKYLEALIRIKYEHETRDDIMIPSRLEKRLMRVFLNHTLIEDPYIAEKDLRNRRVMRALNSTAFKDAINYAGGSDLVDLPTTLTEIKEVLEHIELKRFFSLSVERSVWESDKTENCTTDDFLKLFHRSIIGNGVESLFRFLGVSGQSRSDNARSKKILWLADEAGEVMIDLAIIRYLAKMGHKIVIAFKEGPLYTKVDFDDAQDDEVLRQALDKALWIKEKELSKNDLVKILQRDNNIIAISDGTRENLNLILSSTTFARIFKEVDGVISRGKDQWRRFFDTRFRFTQDIFNISEGDGASVSISYKPKHPSVLKYSHGDLENKAKTIIDRMQTSKKKGMTVVFYSAIIGSIPGKIKMAKKILSVFIENLKKQSDMTFIINPAEYFEPGMDADDLMYMWEIVQRSGYIDIWRFQTYEDIVRAFDIMNEKVPPEWVGKDATFSTGCTKEMRIALDVQQKHPEMQIIGPSNEKFMRRKEYGIGKMYDQRLGSDIL
ncbi:ARMT1-like domain-containing protein [Thermodesulfobacteriota bacterium]